MTSETNTASLQSEFDSLIAELDAQPEPVRAIWRYGIVLMLLDDEKARVVESHHDQGMLHLIVETLNGDRFSIMRPPMSDEVEQYLLELVREIVEEDQAKG